MMCVCEKTHQLAKVSFSNSWTISLHRVSTVLSTHGGVEEKLIGNPSKMTEFPLQYHFFYLNLTNEYYIKLIDFFDVSMHFELVLSTFY